MSVPPTGAYELVSNLLGTRPKEFLANLEALGLQTRVCYWQEGKKKEQEKENS